MIHETVTGLTAHVLNSIMRILRKVTNEISVFILLCTYIVIAVNDIIIKLFSVTLYDFKIKRFAIFWQFTI